MCAIEDEERRFSVSVTHAIIITRHILFPVSSCLFVVPSLAGGSTESERNALSLV